MKRFFCVYFLLGMTSTWLHAVELPVFDRLGGDFNLESTLDKKIGLNTFKGKVVLLSFGFSSCPQVCPTTLSRLAKVYQQMQKHHNKEPQIVFITVDPKQDTVARLKEYLALFNADIVGLTGSDEALGQVARSFGAVYMNQPTGNDIAHTEHVYLLDQQGRVRKLYSRQTDLAEMEKDILSLENAN